MPLALEVQLQRFVNVNLSHCGLILLQINYSIKLAEIIRFYFKGLLQLYSSRGEVFCTSSTLGRDANTDQLPILAPSVAVVYL